MAKSATTNKHNAQSSCLASIDRSFQENGFSSKSRKLLSASWRKGTHKDYTGIFVGQHQLIKGVFNSRPPKVKLLSEWDLQLVLNMLQKEPFEPLNKASLKVTTVKTIFLMAISTCRGCGDLQSLQLGEGSVCEQKKGVTFIRHSVAKQDRDKHFSSKIFVPAFAWTQKGIVLLLEENTVFKNKARRNFRKKDFLRC